MAHHFNIYYYPEPLSVICSEETTQIRNSYRITAWRDILNVIYCIRYRTFDRNAIHRRSVFMQACEWRANNVLHALGINRKRTASVELGMGHPWYRHLAHILLAPLGILQRPYPKNL